MSALDQYEYFNHFLSLVTDAMEKPNSLDLLKSGKCLCLECGFGPPNWPKMHGGVEYPTCTHCGKLAISWDHIDDLGATVSEAERKQLKKEYPAIIKAALKAEAIKEEEQEAERFDNGQFGVGA